ncbi:hypothetical protein AQ731_04205 [Burkholderia pseudomallei]|nr:hypothetical protein AQ731_04205 [Burkholderia pseudomallei]
MGRLWVNGTEWKDTRAMRAGNAPKRCLEAVSRSDTPKPTHRRDAASAPPPGAAGPLRRTGRRAASR